MDTYLSKFENIVRRASAFTTHSEKSPEFIHPFDMRDIHPKLPENVRDLFDDGHYPQATFEAFKFIDKEVQRLSAEIESGVKLMMKVFSNTSPILTLTPCSSISDQDEQKGYQFLFAGSILAIRNPRGHEYSVKDDPDICLDHLSLASVLLRRLEKAGYTLK